MASMVAAVAQLESDLLAEEENYWSLSRTPLASLLFVAPLLLVYETASWRLGADAARNGADVWLRSALDALGFGHSFLLPAMTVALLLAWHHVSCQRWRLPMSLFYGMALECLLLAVALVTLAQIQGAVLKTVGISLAPSRSTSSQLTAGTAAQSLGSVEPASAPVDSARRQSMRRLISFLGAGIYEEVLFRLMLMPLCVALLQRLGASRASSILTAVVVTSVLFALAHYVGPHGDRWQSFSFLFRVLAGGFFAWLFVERGFGVAAGAHAGYDILVGMRLIA
jgi:membrane protease YdiL (CAAX protease family)